MIYGVYGVWGHAPPKIYFQLSFLAALIPGYFLRISKACDVDGYIGNNNL